LQAGATLKELISYFNHAFAREGHYFEYIGFLQGCIPKSVFVGHCLKVENVKKLMNQILAVTATIENSLLS
jgi:hypothetical protein